MLQGVSGQLGNSGDGGASAQPPPQPHGGGELGGGGGGSVSGGFSEEERGRFEEGERSSGGGNRWPRQETLALLKIRSDMDVAFRDSSLKGPLWDEVSRKLAELGYHRSAKKCKEKFENVYKYHKRTKEGRTSKADGKTYRFFDQLEALEANPGSGGSHPPPPPATANLMAPAITSNPQPVTVPSVVITPFSISTGSHQNNVSPISVAAPAVTMPTMNHHVGVGGFPFPPHPNMSGSTDSTSSSSTSSDDEPPERRKKRKRKWKDFFGRLMKEVVDKQEELQMKFLERIERRERERIAREEAWRMEEMAKMNREHDLLVQERSMAAAKDAAVITFLQKITEQNPNAVPQIPVIPFLQQQQQNQKSPPPPPSASAQPQPHLQPQPQPVQQQQQQTPPPHQTQQMTSTVPVPVSVPIPVSVPVPVPVSLSSSALVPATTAKNPENYGGESVGGENMLAPSPSRWPKAEINALIKLRTTLDTKYQENAPKGPLWEEISAAMRKLGYNRNAKRCKEKWENINKYYKKVKESSKKRPEDSKTCPYFHQLDAIYREKANQNPGFSIKPETTQMAPIMAQPEQQWPLPSITQHHHQHHQHQQQQQQQQQQRPLTNESTGAEDHESENNDDDYDDEDENYDNEGGQYEIVPNKTSSMATS